MEKTGKAYGFFYYKGKAEDISEKLPYIRDMYETPSDLELSLTEGVCKFIGTSILGRKALAGKPIDTQLRDVATQAKRQHMSHVLEATLPNVGNKMTADLLGDIMTGVNFSLYDKEEPFYAGIVYKRGEQYVFRRK